jgi:galactokinase
VGVATFIEKLVGGLPSVSGVQKALRCQKAEHTFADTPCGIMDQFISAMGKQGNLLLIDCRSQDFKLVPFGAGTDSPVIIVTNSQVKHELSGSEYPDRVKSCREAVAVIQKRHPHVKALRDVTLEMLEEAEKDLSELTYRRARHGVSEDRRTLAAIEALSVGDFARVGELMTLSHESLRDDYEVGVC